MVLNLMLYYKTSVEVQAANIYILNIVFVCQFFLFRSLFLFLCLSFSPDMPLANNVL